MTRSTIAAALAVTLLPLATVTNAHAFTGRRLINAGGGVHETTAQESGSLSLSGMIDFNKDGGASAVQITMALEDSGGDSIQCVLSTPTDVAYKLADNVGTLTLTVASTDTCTAGNVGGGLTFNLVTLTASANAGRITATAITLHDSGGDLVDLTTASGAISMQ